MLCFESLLPNLTDLLYLLLADEGGLLSPDLFTRVLGTGLVAFLSETFLQPPTGVDEILLLSVPILSR